MRVTMGPATSGGEGLFSSLRRAVGVQVQRHPAGEAPYDVDDSTYQRFDAKNSAFGRMVWDAEMQERFAGSMRSYAEVIATQKRGFRREDFALMGASWTVASAFKTRSGGHGDHQGLLRLEPFFAMVGRDALEGPWDRDHLSDGDITQMVKKAGHFLGASLVGIATLDQRWIYSRYFDFRGSGGQGNILFTKTEEVPLPTGQVKTAKVDPTGSARPQYRDDGTLVIPETMNRVVVLAFEMDLEAVSAYPSAVGAAATGAGYSQMAFTTASLAEFIRGLGFNAIPCANHTGLSIPMAIDAGLGELGRQGILITPKYGPRVRLAKIITDLPLEPDRPISFGVTEFCDVCMKCAQQCPGQAISYDKRHRERLSVSNNPAVLKWPVKADRCLEIWQRYGFTDCGNCIRCCPFNKAEGWLHETARAVIRGCSRPVDKLLVKLDDLLRYGTKVNPERFWGRGSDLRRR